MIPLAMRDEINTGFSWALSAHWTGISCAGGCWGAQLCLCQGTTLGGVATTDTCMCFQKVKGSVVSLPLKLTLPESSVLLRVPRLVIVHMQAWGHQLRGPFLLLELCS